MADKVSFIGSGNLATNLAHNFDLAGFEIYQVISKQEANAKKLAQKYGGYHSTKLSDLFSDAKLVFICVNDDAIEQVAKEIPSEFRGIVCHCSGSKSIDVLSDCKSDTGVFYPLQSFTKENVISMLNVPILIEAESISAENTLETLADAISNKVKRVKSEERIKYHLAAVIANNFGNLMYVLSKKYLSQNELDFEVIRPLILETSKRMATGNPEDWQTGPAKRKDVETINRHLSMLTNSDLEEIYSTLSNFIMTKL